MPEFYRQYGGAVCSFAIDKYIYIILNKKFDGGVRVSYAITENVDEPEMLKHDIVRVALTRFKEVENKSTNVEVVSVADIPGGGTGLGSSSSFSVGLLLALNKYYGNPTNRHPADLAYNAYFLERELCHHPVGMQDHFAAAYGGFNFFQFNKDGTVNTIPINLSEANLGMIQHNMMLFWVGKTRKADSILKAQAKGLENDPEVYEDAMAMKNLAIGLNGDLQKDNIASVGTFIGLNWQLKKDLAVGIAPKEINMIYDRAMEAGAAGGKLCGAGGSGFLLFYADHKYHAEIEKAVGLRLVPFKISNEGAQVVYDDGGRA
jgi:D-glycero-alpha-D-manno-heptose-7-phosphate kinase